MTALNVPDSEIIVVDANSHDGTAEFLANQKYIHYIPLSWKDCWAFNNSLGINSAKGDWICVMNPDIYFDERFNILIDFLNSFTHNPYPLVAPQLIFPPGQMYSEQLPIKGGLSFIGIAFTFIQMGRLLDKKFARGFFGRIRDPVKNYETVNGHKVWRVEHPIGSMFIIHVSTVREFGWELWQKGYTLAAADSDMFRMANEMGVEIFVVPEARVVHEQGHSVKKMANPLVEYELAYGFTLFARYWNEHPYILSAFYFLDAIVSPIGAIISSKMNMHKRRTGPKMTLEQFTGQHMVNSSFRLFGMIDAWRVKINDRLQIHN